LILNKSTKPEWPEIKAELKKETFKNTVLNFDKDKIGKKCSAFISNTYLKNEGAYNIDVFFKASQAAGPLAMWCKSIIQYSEIFEKIEPLRNEVQ